MLQGSGGESCWERRETAPERVKQKGGGESEATAERTVYCCCWGILYACFKTAANLARQNGWKGRRWGMSVSDYELEEMTVCALRAGGLGARRRQAA